MKERFLVKKMYVGVTFVSDFLYYREKVEDFDTDFSGATRFDSYEEAKKIIEKDFTEVFSYSIDKVFEK